MIIEDRPARADSGRARVDAVIRVLAVVGVLIPLLGAALDLVIRIGGSQSGLLDGIRNLLYPDAEGNVFAWYSTIMLAGVGIGFVLVALASAGAGRRVWPFVALGSLALLLSVDEAAYLHERLAIFASELGLNSSFTYQWLLLGIPIAVVVGLMLLWLARRIDPRLRRRLIVAGVVFLAGAIGGEVVGGLLKKVELGLEAEMHLIAHNLEVFVEESLEILGAVLALRAVLLHLNVSNGPEGLAFSLRDGNAATTR